MNLYLSEYTILNGLDIQKEDAILEGLFDRFFGIKTDDNDEEVNPKTAVERHENLKGSLFSRVIIDEENKQFIIKGINFVKFIERVKEMYKYKGIQNLFAKRYSAWQEYLWNKEKITRDEMKIVSLTVPLFFALEMYKIFQDLADFYKLPYYQKTADMIWNKTWISNFEKIHPEKTSTKNLSNISITLKDYQIRFIQKYTALKKLYSLNGYILSFEQGLGKTLTSIALAECLNKEQIVIICPNSLKENWANEIKFYFSKYADDALFKHDVYINNNSKFTNKNGPKYIIVNQENIPSIFSIVDRFKDSMIIVDECHNFRNPEADRVKALIKLKEMLNCKDNLLMSGTPIKATPNEIIPMLIMIDPYFNDEMAEIYRKSFNKYSEEISSVVRERFSRVIYRKTKQQVLKQLPEKHIIPIKLSIKGKESEYYVETIRNRIIASFTEYYSELYKQYKPIAKRFEELVLKYSSDDKKNTKEYLRYINHEIDYRKENLSVHEKRQEIYDAYLKTYVYPNVSNATDLKELKFCASKYVYMENSAMGKAVGEHLPPARTQCYIDIINSNIDYFINKIKTNTKKTVIFTPYLSVAKYASEVLTKNGINNVLIIGATKNRMDLITAFKESDNIDVLVATTQTLSTGVTLTEANQMIFLGTPYREADFEQACDRIHRIGQTSDVNIYITLLKSSKKNITDRVKEIMDWSAEASGEFMSI